jgi:hypothetical protein
MYTYICTCYTESSTKRRMAVAPRGTAEALQELGAGDGPGGGAAKALMTLCAGAVASPGVHPYVKLAFIAVAITYVLWWFDY